MDLDELELIRRNQIRGETALVIEEFVDDHARKHRGVGTLARPGNDGIPIGPAVWHSGESPFVFLTLEGHGIDHSSRRSRGEVTEKDGVSRLVDAETRASRIVESRH